MSNYDDNPNLGCDKAAVTAFLEKLKAHFDTLITCKYFDADMQPLEGECPEEAMYVELCIGDKKPIKVFMGSEDALTDIMKNCCPVAPIEVPMDAFSDPAYPTQSEVNAWIAENHPDAPENTLFYYGIEGSGNPDDPDWVWSYDGNGNSINIQDPDCCVDVVHVPVPKGENPVEWITANVQNYPPGTKFYVGNNPLNPVAVFTSDANFDIICDRRPPAVHTPSSFTDNGDGSYTHDAGDGSEPTTICENLVETVTECNTGYGRGIRVIQRNVKTDEILQDIESHSSRCVWSTGTAPFLGISVPISDLSAGDLYRDDLVTDIPSFTAECDTVVRLKHFMEDNACDFTNFAGLQLQPLFSIDNGNTFQFGVGHGNYNWGGCPDNSTGQGGLEKTSYTDFKVSAGTVVQPLLRLVVAFRSGFVTLPEQGFMIPASHQLAAEIPYTFCHDRVANPPAEQGG